MLHSRIRKKLALGETVLCAKASFPDPDIVELMGTFGFDGVWICLEHRRVDPAVVNHMIRASRLGGMDAIIRIKPSNHSDLLWLLEAGARGVMLPKVVSIDEVREVVAMMKFPPAGRRGYDGIQAESHFGRMPPAEYLKQANDENFLLVQIEEPDVVPDIDAIAALPGVDVLFVGPGDLTLTMGKLGQVNDPDVLAILQQVVDSCKKHGKVAGIPCAVDQVPKYHAMGFRFFNVISDYRGLVQSLTKVQADLGAAGFPLQNRLG
ncbi:HpcH/HpaI aldolase family protein [Horticoccus sp. 23ND18S-11]|uniref:HpcH/HpaI aldolase family protein n=1 Tax=Horticoccus sp. 23ND18S-11 TaxID=3391832 RepID=UPI0039C9D49C